MTGIPHRVTQSAGLIRVHVGTNEQKSDDVDFSLSPDGMSHLLT